MESRVILQRRRDTFKKQMQLLNADYNSLKAQLMENETYTQVSSSMFTLQKIHGIFIKICIHPSRFTNN